MLASLCVPPTTAYAQAVAQKNVQGTFTVNGEETALHHAYSLMQPARDGDQAYTILLLTDKPVPVELLVERFDARFAVDDLVVMEQFAKLAYFELRDADRRPSLAPWLRESTRNAIAAIYDLALSLEPLRIEKSALTAFIKWPHEGINATTLTALLRHQSAVADALDGGTGAPQFGLSI